MAANDWIKGLIVGGLIGAVLGILYAPKSGKETREDICKSTEELLAKAKEQYEQAKTKMEDMSSHGKETYADKKERLKRAIEAGVEAFKEEKAGSPQA